jgi:NADH-quinone oxidoreductase subunit A
LRAPYGDDARSTRVVERPDTAAAAGGSPFDNRLLRSAAMLSDYAPILVFLGIVLVFAVGAQLLNAALGPKRPSAAKELPYESGIVPRESARRRFSVSFYVTAMLFIIFDVESIFLFPWATIVRELKIFGVVEMGIFILTLLVGLVYVWRKGALRWD